MLLNVLLSNILTRIQSLCHNYLPAQARIQAGRSRRAPTLKKLLYILYIQPFLRFHYLLKIPNSHALPWTRWGPWWSPDPSPIQGVPTNVNSWIRACCLSLAFLFLSCRLCLVAPIKRSLWVGNSQLKKSKIFCIIRLLHSVTLDGRRSVRPLYSFASVRSHRVRSPINMFRTRIRSPSIIFAYHIFNTLYILIISKN